MTDEPASTLEEQPAADPAAEGQVEIQTGEGPLGSSEKEGRLHQTVEVKNIGPCKKYVKVTVSREDVDKALDEKIGELETDAIIPGFRPGKAPRELIVRKFRKGVNSQVKVQILLASLEQLADENDIAALAMPNIDPAKLDIPKEGPFVYEFEVEVRPEFDLPAYKGLKLKRPVRTISDADVELEENRILANYGQIVPKEEGNAQIGDYVIVDLTTRHKDRVLATTKELKLRIDDTLTFKDGVARGFGEKVVGANAGETRVVDIELTDSVADYQLKGETIQATLEIKDVKKLRLPELTHEFLHNFGVHSPEQFHELIRVTLERRAQYDQRQAIREQILEQLSPQQWDLPQDLLQRQASRSFSRRVMEMREMGISDEEIKSRQRLLERDVIQNTATSLKEHFILQKIADLEKIDIDEDDLNAEIESIADQRGESPRRLKAQLERENLMDALASQMVERLALELVISNAEMTDVAIGREAGLASVEQQTVPGEMKDPTAAPPEEKKEEGNPA
jgi:trigger factor